MYKNPDDIDAYPAALSETALPGKLGQLGFWNQITTPSLNLEHHFVSRLMANYNMANYIARLNENIDNILKFKKYINS